MLKVLIEGKHTNHPVKEGQYKIDPLTSSVTLIRPAGRGGKNILVDPGAFIYGEKVVAELAEEGIKPAEIDYVFLTHYHIDHAANLHLFWPTEVHSPKAWLHPDGTCDIFKDNRLRALPEGIELLETPGHTAHHVSIVYRDQGKTYVVAGDAIREDIITGKSAPSAANWEQFKESMKRIFAVADVIIPGHGAVIEGEKLAKLKELVENK